MTTGTATYAGKEITVTFSAEMEQADYGVPGSPVWWEPDMNTLEIVSLEILGAEWAEDSLPKELVDSIYELADDLDWEPAE